MFQNNDMESHRFSAFDQSAEDLDKRLDDKSESLIQQSLDQGLYVSYRDHNCQLPEEFVHQYKDGHRELIRVNTLNGKEEFIRNL